MATYTVGKAEGPKLEERPYPVIVLDAKRVEGSFGKERMAVDIGIDDPDYTDDDGNPVHWSEFINISLGKKANLYKLISLLYFGGEPVPDGVAFDDEDCSIDGEPMIGRRCELDWRSRTVENPETHQEQTKTGWDIEFTYDRVRIAKQRQTGKALATNVGEFMEKATETYEKTPKQIREALGVSDNKQIRDFDKAWKLLAEHFGGE